MQVFYSKANELTNSEALALYAYRYAVFVERLGWELPGANDGIEIDQFDRPDTIHVIARDEAGVVCGCARLLPTVRPYLLSDVFPELMCNEPLPQTADVWELSRFASNDLKALMTETIKCATEQGAKRLIAVTSKGVDRILRRLGINWYPIGPAVD
eukprot:gene25485-27658_t